MSSCDRLKSLTVISPITINTQERVKRTTQSKKNKDVKALGAGKVGR